MAINIPNMDLVTYQTAICTLTNKTVLVAISYTPGVSGKLLLYIESKKHPPRMCICHLKVHWHCSLTYEVIYFALIIAADVSNCSTFTSC